MYLIDTAIVLNTLKYSDRAVIIHCFSKENGRCTLIVQNFYSRKKKLSALVFPLSEIEYKYKLSKSESLITANSLNSKSHWGSLYSHPIKSSLILFLSEILYATLKESKNTVLYEFLIQAINTLNLKSQNFAEFHLWLLLELSKHLGFYPNSENANFPYFDLTQGNFIKQLNENSKYILEKKDLLSFKKLLEFRFDLNSENSFNKKERIRLTEILIQYYQLHVEGFKQPKSWNVLREVYR